VLVTGLRLRARTERGAIAIMVAILATALFSCAALAVDLGNAWSRKRSVQKQVDVSALSAGYLLPMTTTNRSTIAAKVASFLNDASNRAVGQVAVTGAQLLNGDTSDGEVVFQNTNGTPCSDNCQQMRVIAPSARVDFGFANVFGSSHVDVQRTATVRVVSELPPTEKTVPFWLPTGCGYGPTEADTTQGGTNQVTETATPTATATATATETRFTPDPGDIGGHVLNGTAITEVGYLGMTTISGYSVNGISGGGVKKVTLRAFPPTGTAYVDFAAQTEGNGVLPSFQVSQADVTKIPGDWWVYALAQKNNSFTYSSTHLVIRVVPDATATATPTPTASATGGVPVGCIGQDRGNFGQLDSPRYEGGAKQTRFARNLALGIDHLLVPYVFADAVPEQKQCDDPGSVLPGAQLDDIARNGNNCIVGDTGNDGPKTYEGLVTGLGDGTTGRLEVANGATTCEGRPSLVMDGHLLNNDVLSCFLEGDATLSSITQTSGVTTDMLNPAVMDSPRFVWVPVVYASDRAQKSFQPIRQFVPGFITDETQTSEATASNGLDINGNSVEVLHVFTFNRDALPTQEGSRTTDYDPDLGGAIVRLVG
jgi:Flp pilus assembly protein TadG